MSGLDFLQAAFNVAVFIFIIYLLWCGVCEIAKRGKK